jgi:hypothetical protein
VALVRSTAPGHGNGRVRPGAAARTVRRAYPHRRHVGRGLVRPSARSVRVLGVGRRVRFVAVTSRRTIAHRRTLRAYLRYSGVGRSPTPAKRASMPSRTASSASSKAASG